MFGTIFGFDATTVSAFDTAYKLSRQPAIQAMMQLSTAMENGQSSARVQQAFTLAQQGYIIDVDIDAYDQDPYITMYQRSVVIGNTWEPSGLQVPGGGTGPVPAGAIPVPNMALPLAQLLALYPPFYPPAPVAPPVTSPIGNDENFQMTITVIVNGKPVTTEPLEVHSALATENSPEGTIYTDASGARWYKHLLGSDLVAPTQRVGVWLGPLPTPWPPVAPTP